MAATISGNNLGLYNSSLTALGQYGPGGSPLSGRAGQSDNIFVNAYSGNLVVQRQDEYLASLGIDLSVARTYNSQGQFDGDNNDNWRLGLYRSIQGLSGTVNTAGSAVSKTFGDGHTAGYAYVEALGAYVSTDGDGAHDSLRYDATQQIWLWSDGNSGVTETYDVNGRLISIQDRDNNVSLYEYDINGMLSMVMDSSGQATQFIYSGNQLVRIDVLTTDETALPVVFQSRMYYTYDNLNRLSQVIVDLSPEDDDISAGDSNLDGHYVSVAGHTYVTSYTYDGDSQRITSIRNGDNTVVEFSYGIFDGEYKVAGVRDGEGGETIFTYDINSTVAIDNFGKQTSYFYDTQGRLIELHAPAVNGQVAITRYFYDQDSNLERVLDANNNETVFDYDPLGNRIVATNAEGGTVVNTYSASNKVLTESVALLTLNGITQLTTRYVYDSEDHLRFVISPQGNVSEYRYDTFGQRISTISYTNDFYDITALAPQVAPSEIELMDWVALLPDLTQTQRSDSYYDFRGQVAQVITYSSVDNLGNGVADGSESISEFVYDANGKLLRTVDARGVKTTDPWDYTTFYVYDGLGRLIATNESMETGALRTTFSIYDDANNRVINTLANNNSIIEVYDKAGRLVSTSEEAAFETKWSQDFELDSAGLTPLPAGYMSLQNGRLVLTSQDAAVAQWPSVWGERLYAFDEGITFYAMLTTGADANGRYAIVGAESPWEQTAGTYRRHAAYIDGNTLYASYYDNGFHSQMLGTVADNASYIVEVVTHDNGTTLYFYEEGSARDSGFVDHRSFTDWGSASLVLQAIGEPGRAQANVFIDDIVEIKYHAPLSQMRYVYDANNNLRISVNPNGGQTHTLYDEQNRPMITIDPSGSVIEIVYDDVGNAIQSIAYANNLSPATMAALVDANGEPVVTDNLLLDAIRSEASDPLKNRVIHMLYDGNDRLVMTIDPEGFVTQTFYDTVGRVTDVIAYALNIDVAILPPTPDVASISNQLISTPMDRHQRSFYDTDSRLIVSLDAEGYLTEYHYDNAGQQTGSTRYASVVEGSWQQAQGIETSSAGGAYYPQVAVDQKGNAVSVWVQHDGTHYSIFANRYIAGLGWQGATLLETYQSGDTWPPQVAMDADGNAMAVWTQHEGDVHKLYASYAAVGQLWQQPILVAQGAGSVTVPQIAFDAQGIAIATWQQLHNGVNSIFASHFIPGLSWQTAVPLELDDVNNAYDPQLAVDSYGNAVVAWRQDNNGLSTIFANRYIVGLGWQGAELLDTKTVGEADAGYAYDAQVAMDERGNAMVVWQRHAANDGPGSIYARRYDATLGWLGLELLETAPESANNPRIAMNVLGIATVVWRQFDGNHYSLYTNRYNPLSGWEGVEAVQLASQGNIDVPQVAIDTQGNTTIVWQQLDANGNIGLYTRQHILTRGWQGVSQLQTAQSGNAYNPALAMDLYGNATLAWHQTDASGMDNVFANTYVSALQQQTMADLSLLKSIILPSSEDRYSHNFYNARGQVIAQVDADGYLTEYAYDIVGNRTKEQRYDSVVNYVPGATLDSLRPSAGGSRITTLSYNFDNQVLTATAYDGSVSVNKYDIVGNLIRTQSGLQAIADNSVTPPQAIAPPDALAHYFDHLGRVVGYIDAGGVLTSFDYDAQGRISAAGSYANSPQAPLWKQDFNLDSSGLTALDVNAMVLQDGRLALTTQTTTASDWPTIYGEREYALSDGVIFRAELNTGIQYDSRYVVVGAQSNPTQTGSELRRHAAYIDHNDLYVSYYDAGWQNQWIGNVKDNTRYVIEVQTHAAGTTLYVYEKGQARDSGFIDQRAYTDWGVARFMAQTTSALDRVPSTVYLDNISEATSVGRLVGDVIVEESPADSVMQYFYSDSDQIIATLQADGTFTSYLYDSQGRMLQAREHALPAQEPLWAQDFSYGSDGLSPLPANYFALQQGSLVLITQDTATTEWPAVWGNRLHNFNDGVIIRSEVTTGEFLDGQFAIVGAESPWEQTAGTYRRHAVMFDNGSIEASYYDGAFTSNYLGEAKANTTYIVEVVTHASGTTLYVYEKGQSRTDGFIDEQAFSDWGTVQFMAQALGEPGRFSSGMKIDNISEATVPGALVGGRIAVTDTQDAVTRFIYDAHGTLVGQSTSETRVSQRSFDLQGRVIAELTGEGNAALDALLASAAFTQADIDQIWQDYGMHYTYDDAGLRTSATDQNGNTQWMYYDAAGRVRVIIQSADNGIDVSDMGEVSEIRYNAFGQVETTIRYATRISTLGLSGGHLGATTLESDLAAMRDVVNDSETTTSYTLRGAVEQVIDPENYTTTQEYNSFGQLQKRETQIQGTNTQLTAYIYDRLGQKILSVDNNGGAFRLSQTRYDAFGRVIETIDASGNSTFNDYGKDGQGRVIVTTTDALGHSRTTTYDAYGRVFSERDALGYDTQYIYDDVNRSVTIRTPEGIEARTITNRHGEAVEIIDGNGNRTRYDYDKNGNLLLVTDAQGNTTQSQYDNANLKIATIDTRNIVTEFQYDAANRLISRTIDPATASEPDRLNIKTEYRYDAKGNRIISIDAKGIVTEIVYDNTGQVETVTVDPTTATYTGLNLVTRYSYDGLGNTLTVTKGDGTPEATSTRHLYDSLGRRSYTFVDPSGLNLATRFIYDENNNLTTKIEGYNTPEARTTRYVYNVLDQLIYSIDAAGGVSYNEYDANGRSVKTINYATAIDLSLLSDNPSEDDIQSQLDPIANPARDQERRTVYDRDGSVRFTLTLTSVVDSNGYTVQKALVSQNQYDNNGNVIGQRQYAKLIDLGMTGSITDLNSATQAIADDSKDQFGFTVYDSLNRASFSLTAIGQIKPDNVTSVTTYALSESVFDSAGSLIKSLAYAKPVTLSQLGVLTVASIQQALSGIGDSANDRSARIVYDANNRAVFTLDDFNQVEATRYDSMGNITGSASFANPVTLANNLPSEAELRAALELVAAPEKDQYTEYDYDADGRLKTVKDAEGKIEYYGYDAVGNKTQFTNKNGAHLGDVAYTWNYVYDKAGRVTHEITPEVEVTRIADMPTDGYAWTQGSWQTQQQVVTTTGPAPAPESALIARDNLGGAMAVWVVNDAASSSTVFASYYQIDSGWQAPIAIATHTVNTIADNLFALSQIVMAPGGETMVLWQGYDDATGMVNLYVNRFTINSGWQASDIVYSGAPIDAQLAVDDMGNALVTWVQDNATSDELMVRQYLQGTGWLDPATLASNIVTNSFGEPSAKLTLDKNGNALLVWNQQGASGDQLYVKRYSVSDGWLPTDVLTTNSNASIHSIRVASNDFGNALVVWRETVSGMERIYARVYDHVNNSWDAPRELLTLGASGYSGNLDVALDHLGNAMVVMQQHNGTRGDIFYSRYDVTQESWSTAAALENDDIGHAQDARVAVDANGNMVAVWQQFDGSNNNIWARRYVVDSGWLVADLVAAVADSPDLAVDRSGNISVLWEQNGAVNARRYEVPHTTTTTVAEAITTYIRYDVLGNVISRTEAYGSPEARTTSYEYDAVGRQTVVTYPEVGVYDPNLDDNSRGIVATQSEIIDEFSWVRDGSTLVQHAGISLTVDPTLYQDTTPTSVTATIYRSDGSLYDVVSTDVGYTVNYGCGYSWIGVSNWNGQVNLSFTSMPADTYTVEIEIRDDADANTGTNATYGSDQDGKWVITTSMQLTVGTVYEPIPRSDSYRLLSSSTRYDALGRAVSNTDTAGNDSHKVYDQLGRVIYEIDAEHYVTGHAYDNFGNEISMTRYVDAISFSEHAQPFTATEVESLLQAAQSPDGSHVVPIKISNDVLLQDPRIKTFAWTNNGNSLEPTTGYSLQLNPEDYGATPTSVTAKLYRSDGSLYKTESTYVGHPQNTGCGYAFHPAFNWDGQVNLSLSDLPPDTYTIEITLRDDASPTVAYNDPNFGVAYTDDDGTWVRTHSLTATIGAIPKATLSWAGSTNVPDTTTQFLYRRQGSSGAYSEAAVALIDGQNQVELDHLDIGNYEFVINYLDATGAVVKTGGGIFNASGNKVTTTLNTEFQSDAASTSQTIGDQVVSVHNGSTLLYNDPLQPYSYSESIIKDAVLSATTTTALEVYNRTTLFNTVSPILSWSSAVNIPDTVPSLRYRLAGSQDAYKQVMVRTDSGINQAGLGNTAAGDYEYEIVYTNNYGRVVQSGAGVFTVTPPPPSQVTFLPIEDSIVTQTLTLSTLAVNSSTTAGSGIEAYVDLAQANGSVDANGTPITAAEAVGLWQRPSIPATAVPAAPNRTTAADQWGNTLTLSHAQSGSTWTMKATRYDGNTGLSLPEDIATGSGTISGNYQVAFDAEGNAMAVWQITEGTQTKLYTSRFSHGGGWHAVHIIDTGTDSASNPQLVYDAKDDAFVIAWLQSDGVATTINTQRYRNDGGWQAIESVSNLAATVTQPQLEFDAQGNGIVVWQHNNGVTTEIHASRYLAAQGWQGVEAISSELAGNSANAYVAFDSQGLGAVIWQQTDAGVTTVYANQIRLFQAKAIDFVVASVYDKVSGDLVSQAHTRSDADNYTGEVRLSNGQPLANGQYEIAINYHHKDGTVTSNTRFDYEVGIQTQYSHNTTLSWDASDQPANTSVVFLYALQGGSSYTEVTPTLVGNNYQVVLTDANPGGYDYRIEYRDNSISLGWDAANTINTITGYSASEPAMAMDDFGNGMAIWSQFDGTVDNIYARRYVAGQGWEAAVELLETGSGRATSPEIAFDHQGNVMAVWLQHDGITYSLFARRYVAGQGWETTTTLLENGNGDVAYPDIAYDALGNAMVIWRQYTGTEYNIYAKRYLVSQGWEATTTLLDNASGPSYNPDLTLDAQGNAMVLWSQSGTSGGDIISKSFTITGGWQSGVSVLATGSSAYPEVAFDHQGNAMAVWYQNDGTGLNVYSKRYIAGSGWEANAVLLENAPDTAQLPQIAMDSNGNGLAVWLQSDGAYQSLFGKRYVAGAGWEQDARLLETLESNISGIPQLSMNANGDAIVAWQQIDGTNYGVFTKSYTFSNGWQSDVTVLDTTTNNAHTAAIAITANGDALAMWLQHDGTAYQVAASHYVAAKPLISESVGTFNVELKQLAEPNARTINKTYDQRNQLIDVIQPEVHVYDTGAAAGSEYFLASPTTRNSYNTFGEVVKQAQLVRPDVNDIDGGDWSETHYYYNRLGQKIAEIDALGYIATSEYDAFGNIENLTEYAKALAAGSWNVAGYAAPVATTALTDPNSAIGHDRSFEFTYDRLNRKLTETRVDVATSKTVLKPIITNAVSDIVVHNYAWAREGNSLVKVEGQSITVDATAFEDTTPTSIVANIYSMSDGSLVDTVTTDVGYYTAGCGNYWTPVSNWNGQINLGYGELADGDYRMELEIRDDATQNWLEPGPDGTDSQYYDGTDGFWVRSSVHEFTVSKRSQGNELVVENSVEDLTTSFSYDALGNITRVTDVTNSTTFTYYDVLGRATAVAGPMRRTPEGTWVTPLSTYGLNAYGNIIHETRHANSAVSASESGYAAGQRDYANDQNIYNQYDAFGQTIMTLDSEGLFINYAYDDNSNLVKQWQSRTDLDGTLTVDTTFFEYDKLGQQTATRTLVDATTEAKEQVHYNAFGEIVAKGLNDNWHEYYDYDDAGRVWRSNDKDGVDKVYLYNLLGRATSEIKSDIYDLSDIVYSGPQSVVHLGSNMLRSHTEYDLLGRQLRHSQAALTHGMDTRYIAELETHTDLPIIDQDLDRWGNVLTLTAPDGSQTTYRYNDLNKAVLETKPQVNVTASDGITSLQTPVTRYAYDGLGRLLETIDANNQSNRNLYDEYGQLISEYQADGAVISYRYDAQGRRIYKVDGEGNVFHLRYDRNNRLLEERDGQGDAKRYVYDEVGNRTRSYDALNHRTSHYYDGQGNVIKTQTPMGQESYMEYDLRGNKTREWYSGNNDSITWLYDYFGKQIGHKDLGDADYTYAYDFTGQLLRQTNTRGQDMSYAYYSNGYLMRISDNATSAENFYDYSISGNRTRERFSSTSKVYEDAHISYDSWSRVTDIADERYSLHYDYDAVGNRRHINSSFFDTKGKLTVHDNWYLYDGMNRITLAQGVLQNNQIMYNDTQGVSLAYDFNGNRAIAEYKEKDGSGNYVVVRDHYSYDANKRLTSTDHNFKVIASRNYDKAGRLLTYRQYNQDATNSLKETRQSTYNDNGWLTNQKTFNSSGAPVSTLNYNHDSRGNVTSYSMAVHVGTAYTNYYNYTYAKYEGYKEKVVAGTSTYFQPGNTTTTYDVNGNVIRIVDKFNANKTRDFVVNTQGMAVQKTENGKNQYYFYANNKPVGSYGDLTTANFDYNYTPVSAQFPGSTPSSYIFNQGDTLQSIALSVYGDGALWYLIADANGVQSESELTPGQSLKIPNVISNIHNDSTTFKPYSPGEIIGDTTPTLPDPPPPPEKDGKCGVLGQIIVIIVAVVVSYVTAGALSGTMGAWAAAAIGAAAGSIASQVVAMGLGLQESFSWKSVASAAITAGLTKGVGFDKADTLGKAMSNAITNNVVGQAVNISLDLQDDFNWHSVAAAAIAAPVNYSIDKKFGLGAFSTNENGAEFSRAGLGRNIALESTRSVIKQSATIIANNGGKMEWTQVAIDAFGNGIGNSIVDHMKHAEIKKQEAILRDKIIAAIDKAAAADGKPRIIPASFDPAAGNNGTGGDVNWWLDRLRSIEHSHPELVGSVYRSIAESRLQGVRKQLLERLQGENNADFAAIQQLRREGVLSKDEIADAQKALSQRFRLEAQLYTNRELAALSKDVYRLDGKYQIIKLKRDPLAIRRFQEALIARGNNSKATATLEAQLNKTLAGGKSDYLQVRLGKSSKAKDITNRAFVAVAQATGYGTRDFDTTVRIQHLHPSIRRNVAGLINEVYDETGKTLRVVQSLRTWDEQNQLHAIGTGAPAGRSLHHTGLAFDIALMDGATEIDWKALGYNIKAPNRKVTEFGLYVEKKANDYGFSWGGRFKSSGDFPHFQIDLTHFGAKKMSISEQQKIILGEHFSINSKTFTRDNVNYIDLPRLIYQHRPAPIMPIMPIMPLIQSQQTIA